MFSLRLNSALRSPLNRRIVNGKLLRLVSSTSVEPVRTTSKEDDHKDLKIFETLKNIAKKARIKKPQRPPFVKNILLGDFDTEILTFPQLEKEEVEDLEREALQIEKLVNQKHMVGVDKFSNKNFRQNLSDYRTIGLQASQFLDGRELGSMETLKFLEALSIHNLRESIVHNEQFTVQTLVRYANEELKKKFLYPMMKADKIGAFCMTEENMGDISTTNTQAELSGDQKSWVLNGSKTWVVNGCSADYFIVLAVTNIIQRDIHKYIRLTAFLVEKDLPGVSWKKINNCDIDIACVSFENVLVPIENIIGHLNKGEDILKSVISDFRLGAGSSCISLSKKMLTNLHNSIVEQVTEKNQLHDTDAIKSKIGEMMVNLFAMESVTYLTAGLQDWYENQDTLVETSIVKAFCSQSSYNISSTCLDMIGTPAVVDTHWCKQLHKDSLNYLTLHETNESQKLIIALLCLQHAGQTLAEKVKMSRNPFFHATYHLTRTFKYRKQQSDDPKLDLRLGDSLHPSLQSASLHLEYCVKRLEWAAEGLLARHGLDVVNKHVDLRRLADSIIDTYVATACLGRASRSYCIGLQNAESEIIMTNAFCLGAQRRVRENIKDIFIGSSQNNDDNFDFVAKKFFTYKGYYLKHPTSRNF